MATAPSNVISDARYEGSKRTPRRFLHVHARERLAAWEHDHGVPSTEPADRFALAEALGVPLEHQL